jgi:hypothetical protein
MDEVVEPIGPVTVSSTSELDSACDAGRSQRHERDAAGGQACGTNVTKITVTEPIEREFT